MIHVENLTKYYGPIAAIQNISFKVGQGEILGFLGPSGAGKTTTMRILTAYTPPSEGFAAVNGFDVFNDSLEVRKRVGYLPESVPLYNDLTVADYLDYVAALRKVNKRSRQVQKTLEKTNLGDQANILIGKLSKGMRQRIGIAQAILHDPKILILDEPTLGLDPQQIIDVRHLIKNLGSDHTIILSTHTLSEVEQLCNRILIINKGQIVAEDTPESLLARLEGNERIRLKVNNAPPNAPEILFSLDEVSGVCPIDANTFELECANGIDCRPMLAQFVVEQGWGLLELHAIGVSLESVFFELISGQEKNL
jgi:ABC-2 type transport system ATP-binding protein